MEDYYMLIVNSFLKMYWIIIPLLCRCCALLRERTSRANKHCHVIIVLCLYKDYPPNNRRIVDNQLRYIRYENVTKTDAQVLQCNASNAHGYIFSNAFLNVVGEFSFSSSYKLLFSVPV